MFVILILNCDRSTGMNFVQSLRLAKQKDWGDDVAVLGVAKHPLRMFLSEPDQTFLVDHDDEDLVSMVERIEKRIGAPVDLVYETKSADHMLRLSAVRDRLPTFLAPHSILEVFEDKYLTFQHLSARGYPVPMTFLVNNPADVMNAFMKLGQRAAWVRDTQGQGGRGAFGTTSAAQVLEEITRRNTWGKCTISEQLPTDRVHGWRDRLSARLLPGEMVTWTAVYAHGEVVASQVRKRLYWEHADLVESGVTGYSGAMMTLDDRDIHDLSDEIVRSFDWAPQGPLGIDYLVDDRGQLRLTEIQASRFFTSTYPLALLGLNFPQLLVDAFRSRVHLVTRTNPCPEGYVYVQRFGSAGRLLHRDQILSGLMASRLAAKTI